MKMNYEKPEMWFESLDEVDILTMSVDNTTDGLPESELPGNTEFQ